MYLKVTIIVGSNRGLRCRSVVLRGDRPGRMLYLYMARSSPGPSWRHCTSSTAARNWSCRLAAFTRSTLSTTSCAVDHSDLSASTFAIPRRWVSGLRRHPRSRCMFRCKDSEDETVHICRLGVAVTVGLSVTRNFYSSITRTCWGGQRIRGDFGYVFVSWKRESHSMHFHVPHPMATHGNRLLREFCTNAAFWMETNPISLERDAVSARNGRHRRAALRGQLIGRRDWTTARGGHRSKNELWGQSCPIHHPLHATSLAWYYRVHWLTDKKYVAVPQGHHGPSSFRPNGPKLGFSPIWPSQAFSFPIFF